MQETQNLKKKNLYIILVGYTVSYIIFIISQMFYYPTSFSFLTLNNLIVLIEIIIVYIQLLREKIEYAFIISLYPLLYIILRILSNVILFGTYTHMTFMGHAPIQVYISHLFLQPICVICFVVIYYFINKFKKRDTINDAALHLEKPLYLYSGIHLIIGSILSYFMNVVFIGIFEKSFV